MKKAAAGMALLVLFCFLCACGGTGEANGWQEQYDLGVKYLSEGNYAEAVIAFTAAIEIDPKRPEAFIGRGDAYIGTGETAEDWDLARIEYESALALDETLADAWLGLSRVYTLLGDAQRAAQILEEGYAAAGDPRLLASAEQPEEQTGEFPRTEQVDGYELQYDAQGRLTLQSQYDQDGVLLAQWAYGEDGRVCQHITWGYNGIVYDVTYTYTDGSPEVDFNVDITSTDGWYNVHEQRSYTMSSPDNLCMLGSYSADISHLIVYTIEEYVRDDAAHQAPLKYAGYSLLSKTSYQSDGTLL